MDHVILGFICEDRIIIVNLSTEYILDSSSGQPFTTAKAVYIYPFQRFISVTVGFYYIG